MPRSFKEATSLLCLSAPELAEIFGLSAQTIHQARLDPAKAGYRSPPPGWEQELAKVARARATELERLAAELEGLEP